MKVPPAAGLPNEAEDGSPPFSTGEYAAPPAPRSYESLSNFTPSWIELPPVTGMGLTPTTVSCKVPLGIAAASSSGNAPGGAGSRSVAPASPVVLGRVSYCSTEKKGVLFATYVASGPTEFMMAVL